MTITAKVIAASRNPGLKAIYTLELEYPRFIHSELMTHRVFSRNAASSRAIPIEKMLEQIRTNPAAPIHWGKNQPRMQAKEELTGFELKRAKFAWEEAARYAANAAEKMMATGAHKQIVNRILEPYVHIKTIVTSTEWDNFFELRNHPDAQPEIHELARVMLEAMLAYDVKSLNFGEFHVPYINWEIVDQKQKFYTFNQNGDIINLTTKEALMISASCCAQVSYRKQDDSLEKAQAVFDRLVGSVPFHASPFEHQARASTVTSTKQGNFRGGWDQYRHIFNEV